MSEETKDDAVEKAILKASDIAKKVPENLQEAAFNRALDALLGRSVAGRPGDARSTKHGGPMDRSIGDLGESIRPSEVRITKVMRDLDRTAVPEISPNKPPLENALRVLLAARDLAHVDGLTPAEVCQVLSEKFRISVAESTVRMALGKAGAHVNRIRSGRGFAYRIMQPGESFLETPGKGPDTRRRSAGRKRSSAGGSVAKDATGKREGRSSKESRVISSKKASAGRPGPLDVVTKLVKDGYFKEAKTVAQVLEHLKHKRGYVYKTSDIAVSLLRLVRSEQIDRHKNKDGQYEYKAR